MKRPLFGVIAAQIADTEQKQLLQGILTQAQTLSANVAVFSNIYNPNETNESLFEENSISGSGRNPPALGDHYQRTIAAENPVDSPKVFPHSGRCCGCRTAEFFPPPLSLSQHR